MTSPDAKPQTWKRPEILLILVWIAMPMSWSAWQALINNFAIERAAFTGVEIGLLQSLREVPGFLAFGVVFLLLIAREQNLMLLTLALMGIGTAITGFFPGFWGLCATTFVMSVGFHYHETLRLSLALQWSERGEAAPLIGKLVSMGSLAGLVVFCVIWLALDVLELDFAWIYMLGGGATVLVALFCRSAFPLFPAKAEQRAKMVIRKRYWLYYALTLMAGARRQIFQVFAGFLMVEKFGFDAAAVTMMFLANGVVTVIAAPHVGRLVRRWGERKALSLEYVGLAAVFLAYAFVETAWIAVCLYILDHLFFSMAMAVETYFQKIADPRDIAAGAGVANTVNHVAAVGIPAAFGLIWIVSPGAVFLAGAAMAGVSLGLARLIPPEPAPGRETMLARPLDPEGGAA